MTKRSNRPDDIAADDLMSRVAAEIEKRELSLRDAASAIGVGVPTLEKHLAGEHVRSDSALKYRNWLAGRSPPRNVFVFASRQVHREDEAEEHVPAPPAKPHLVVDIFSGCGGLSLGFDLLGGGSHFRTILAVDNQLAPIEVLNRNAASLGYGNASIGRVADLTEFSNEAEFLAFFLEHVSEVEADLNVAERLNGLANSAFPNFRKAIAAADQAFIRELNYIRSSAIWQRAVDQLDRSALGQTSVIGFHDHLRLPRTGARPVCLPVVLWGDGRAEPAPGIPDEPSSELLQRALLEWDGQVEQLAARREATGRGQLTASARRVRAFVRLLQSVAMARVRDSWALWRARRLQLRSGLFENPLFASQLRALYSKAYPVSVLVGGPPCQGFSRIGRGKIRSLREALVHVHGDAQAGDVRNLLFRQYVMVLEALRPEVFLFENVQHFQSTVKADGVEFQATEVLAEAIANMSDGEVAYEISSKVLDASAHGVPQTRQRYFMCGVRADIEAAVEHAETILRPRRQAEVTLGTALSGLPEPDFVGGDGAGQQEAAGVVLVKDMDQTSGFAAWVRRRPPAGRQTERVDGHIARAARADDAAFFALLGPGRRWMDYRADEAPTVATLRSLLDALRLLPQQVLHDLRSAARSAGHDFPDASNLNELWSRVDGSLSLRLLLEQAGAKLGSPHHLLTETYLAKRDGHHGDWIARMDAGRPSKTMVSHMGKDTYGYVHPSASRTISVREAARVQTFPDWLSFRDTALTDAFRMIGNAVPPLLSHAIAHKVAIALSKVTNLSLEERQASAS